MTPEERLELIPKYEAEIVRLEEHASALRAERRGAPWFLLGLLMAPFGMYYGVVLAVGIAVVALSLFGTTIYLTSIRINERLYELEMARAQLEKLRVGDA